MQLSYDISMPIAFPGMIADSGPSDMVTGLCQVTGGAEFGVGIVQGTKDDGFVLPAATGFRLKGVTVHTHRDDNRALAGAAGVPNGETNPIMRKGRIYVLPEQDVAPTDQVFLRHTANGTLTPGHFRKDADTNRADAVTNARWVTSALAGQPAVLEINLP